MKKLDIKRAIIIILLFLGYLWYLYVLLNNWQLASGGYVSIGVIQGIIPLSAVVFISLILNGKIKISIPA